MYKFFSIFFCLISFNASIEAQNPYYDVSWKKDGITIGVGLGLTAFGHVLLQNREGPTLEGINSLSIDAINSIDQSTVYNKSTRAKKASDIVLFSSILYPTLTLFSHECKRDEFQIGIMGTETFLITLGITNIVKATSERYRPFVYDPDVDLDTKLKGDSRLSFLSGHTSVTASMTFFSAKVFSDFHPEANKLLIWAPAALIPATIGFLRVKAGKHFPTDVIAGYALGASVGYLIPAIHKNKNLNLTVSPTGGLGMALTF